MPEVTDGPTTERRKDDHIRINLEEAVQFPRVTTGLERYRFMHQAVPELDLAAVSTETEFFGKRLGAPLLISSMTGGTERAQVINRTLAEAAQHAGIAMGLGSQRAALEDPRWRRPTTCAALRRIFCCSPIWARSSSITATGWTSAGARSI